MRALAGTLVTHRSCQVAHLSLPSEQKKRGGDQTVALPPEFPPVAYVPCHDAVSDANDAKVVYRRTNDGRQALLVYSALDRLKAGLGEN